MLCGGSGEAWSVLREAWGLTCDGSVLGVGVGSTAGVDAAPPLEEAGGVNSAGTLGGDCPTTQTDSGDCSIGPETGTLRGGGQLGAERVWRGKEKERESGA